MLLPHLNSQSNLAALLMVLRVALMYEGCLRWSDLHQLTFGNCTQTPVSLRLCIPAAKTDPQHQGLWATIPASSDPLSAYMLYTLALHTLTTTWEHASLPQRKAIMNTSDDTLPHSFPTPHTSLILSTDQAGELPRSCPLISYHAFLSVLKRWAQPLGLQPSDIGTHSLRRGLSSDWALLGIAPHIRRIHGRWKSSLVADSYIGTETQSELSLQAFAKARGTIHSLSTV